MNLTATDLATLDRAANLLELEALTWREGNGVYRNGEWVLDGSWPYVEARVTSIESAAVKLRDIRRRGLKNFPIDFQI